MDNDKIYLMDLNSPGTYYKATAVAERAIEENGGVPHRVSRAQIERMEIEDARDLGFEPRSSFADMVRPQPDWWADEYK